MCYVNIYQSNQEIFSSNNSFYLNILYNSLSAFWFFDQSIFVSSCRVHTILVLLHPSSSESNAVKLVLKEPSVEVTTLSGPVNFIIAPPTPELESLFITKPDTVTT